MKVLIRIMGLIIVSFIVTLTLIDLINMNVITNEMNNASNIAVAQTQKYIKNIKIDQLEGDTSIYISNDDYRNYFIERYKEQVKDYSIYDFSKTEADYYHGLLYVEISCNKYPKVRKKKLINIIEIDGDYSKGERYKKGYSIWSEVISYKKNEKARVPIEWSNWQREKPDKYYKKSDDEEIDTISINKALTGFINNKEWPKTAYVFDLGEDSTLLNWSFDIYAYINTAQGLKDSFWQPGLVFYYYDGNNKVILNDRQESKYNKANAFSGSEEIKTNKLYIDITSYNPKNGYQSKLNTIGLKNANIQYRYPLYAYVTKWSEGFDISELKEDEKYVMYSYEMIYPRYIDRENYDGLSKTSIWRKDEYRKVLESYFRKYEKSI